MPVYIDGSKRIAYKSPTNGARKKKSTEKLAKTQSSCYSSAVTSSYRYEEAAKDSEKQLP